MTREHIAKGGLNEGTATAFRGKGARVVKGATMNVVTTERRENRGDARTTLAHW